MQMVETGLAGKVVLITGANNPHGIGAGAAYAFAAQGARLFLHGYRGVWKSTRSQSMPTDKTAEEPKRPGEAFYNFHVSKPIGEVLDHLRQMGVKASGWEGDLSDPGSIPQMFDAAEEKLGPVEVLINNAAYWEPDTFIPADESLVNKAVELWTSRPSPIDAGSFDRMFAVNTRAVALMMAEFARRHIDREASWGRIINVSTDAAYKFPSEITYGASKLALEGYSRSAAAELGQFGVTVNTLSLGPIQTGWITPNLEELLLPTIPLGRVGTPGDVADVMVFLASDQARWLTGQTIHVGGGHFM
jgi:3-oxoacyl-[acyl-carrier protein] reductase